MSGHLEYLVRYRSGSKVLGSAGAALLAELDKYAAAQSGAKGSATLVSSDFAGLQTAWEAVVRLAEDNQRTPAEAALLSMPTKELTDRLRGNIAGYLDQQAAKAVDESRWRDTEATLLQTLNLACAAIAIVGMIYAFRSIMRAISSGFAAKQHIEQLFSMADMLQSAACQDDTNEVLRTTAASLLPGFGGALYVFNNSRDRLDLSTQCGGLAEASADHIAPSSCWALKRGKPHLNRVAETALRCSHSNRGQTILEAPMAARGQLYGLLEVIAQGADAAVRLEHIQPIASAIGDAMSLAFPASRCGNGCATRLCGIA
jgi:hypothetical protein